MGSGKNRLIAEEGVYFSFIFFFYDLTALSRPDGDQGDTQSLKETSKFFFNPNYRIQSGSDRLECAL
jgi:hypothetical protein